MRFNKEKLEAELERLGWTKQKLAEEMKVDRQYVDYYLRPGINMTIKTIERFASALNMDGKDLIKS